MSMDLVTIVSGLPRSGTSMMMRMLEAGGLPILQDHLRMPDEDNPKGYFEFERVKQIEKDREWLDDARGKAVKMIAALLRHLPGEARCRIIFMQRDIDEVLASQRQMLIRRGEPTDTIGDQQMAEHFGRHVEKVQAWLAAQPNLDVLYVQYGEVLRDPCEQAARVNRFLGGGLDEARMSAAVDASLHRQRRE